MCIFMYRVLRTNDCFIQVHMTILSYKTIDFS